MRFVKQEDEGTKPCRQFTGGQGRNIIQAKRTGYLLDVEAFWLGAKLRIGGKSALKSEEFPHP
jgi:hypothetical protein